MRSFYEFNIANQVRQVAVLLAVLLPRGLA
jgi:hypothetical protein